MSRMPEPRELDPVAAGLIRASLTGDKFATDRILTRAFEADLDGLFFAFTVANLAGRILAHACGSEAQAVALMDNLINGLVRERARSCGVTARARLRPGLLPAARPRLGSGLPAPSARRIRCWPAVRLAVPRYAALPGPPLLAARRAALPGHLARVHSPGSSAAPVWERTAGSYPGCAVTAGAPRRRWRPGARWHRRSSRPRHLPRAAATIRPSAAVRLPAAAVVRRLAGRARVVAVRLWLSRLCPWWRGCRRTIARTGRCRLRGAGVRRPAARRGLWRWPRRCGRAGSGRRRIAGRASASACAVSRSWLLTSGGAAARARWPWRARASSSPRSRPRMMSASSRISRAAKTALRMASSSGLPRCGSGETAWSGLVIPAASR